MSLFSKKRTAAPADIDTLFPDMEDVDTSVVNYNSVLDYLVGLSDDDYTKLGKVATIYRKANRDASEALGVPNEPTSFIVQPDTTEDQLAANIDKPGTILDEDAEFSTDFLEDDIPTKPAKAKKVAVSHDPQN